MHHKLSDIVWIDFETFYSKDYSLRKKAYNTSSYVRDPQFKAHCLAVRDGPRKPSVWYEGRDIAKAIKKHAIASRPICAHNTQFDGFIMSQQYGIIPPYYYDTLAMARGLHGTLTRNDLDTVGLMYGVGGKHPNVLRQVKGIRDLTLSEHVALLGVLGDYCANDNDRCYDISRIQLPVYPDDELDLIDWTTRAFCDPALYVDQALAQEEFNEQVARKQDKQVAAGVSATLLQSADLFAEALRALGVEPPVKISKTTGEYTYAFSKQDWAFTDLLNHEDEMVSNLVAARLATKSTIGETRAKRFLDIGALKLPVGNNYCAAHTTRWGGGNSMNLQNLNRPLFDDQGAKIPGTGRLRESILPPPDHFVGVSDSGQIECRLNAWMNDQKDLLEIFRLYDRKEGPDPYRVQATYNYGKAIAEITKTERFVGKTCLAGNTRVFTNRGIIPLSQVTTKDMVWDGGSWVRHSGLLFNGVREVLSACGITATPDHEMLTGSGWQEWCAVLTDPILFQSALSSANSPWSGTSTTPRHKESCGGTALLSDALAATRAWSTATIFAQGVQHAVISVRRWLRAANDIGNTKTRCLMTIIGVDYSTACLQSSIAAPAQRTEASTTTEGVGSQSIRVGLSIVQRFFAMCKSCLAGTIQSWTSTERKSTAATYPEIFASYQGLLTQVTAAKSAKCKSEFASSKQRLPVYDLVNAGPNHRFTILSDDGPVVVSNCVLGLGYQMGAPRLRAQLALGLGGPAVEIDEPESQRLVNIYRNVNDKIVEGWERAKNILVDMINERDGRWKCIEWDGKDKSIWLPSGLGLHYYGLVGVPDERRGGYSDFQYRERKKVVHTYGGKLIENIMQALGRCIVAEQLLRINKTLQRDFVKRRTDIARVVHMAHDEIISVFPQRYAKPAQEMMLHEMTITPKWAAGLPLASDGGYDVRYSK